MTRRPDAADVRDLLAGTSASRGCSTPTPTSSRRRSRRRSGRSSTRPGPKIGREWPIRYRQSLEERVEILRSFGVRRFSTLPYAHKPGVASFLNDWSRDFAAEVPEVVWSATFFPEPEAAAYVEELVSEGAEVFKVHVQVGEFDLDDPLLDPVWGVLADVGTPVVIHAGSGPVGNAFTGPGAAAPGAGPASEADGDRGPPRGAGVRGVPGAGRDATSGCCLDTTMVFTDFFIPFPAELVPRLADLQPKVLLGSDFPTIPYPYAHQLEGLARLDLGDDWLRAVCWHNGVRLFGEQRAPTH